MPATGCAAATPRFVSADSAVPSSSDASLEQAVASQVQSARVTQQAWAQRSLKQRLSILTSVRTQIARQPRELAVAIDGKDVAESLAAEVLPLLDACRFLETEAPRILRDAVVSRRARPRWLWGTSVAMRREPLGVVLVIGPSNFPLMLPGIQVLQALAAGNTVLVKPAPGSAAVMRQLQLFAEAAGLPTGVFQLLPESTSAATAAMRQRVDKVFLTGSAATGQAVSRLLAETTTPAVMELSGCDAVFVLDDADPELVTDSLVFGLTFNNSQACMAPRRVFATNSMTERLIPLLQQKLRRRERSAWQPLTRPASAQAVQLAAQVIAEATARGATLVSGTIRLEALSDGEQGHTLDGVAILDHVTADMSVARTDLFAPVVSFLRVADDAQAIREAHRCPYALSAAMFGSTARCQELARRLSAGCVVINDIIVPSADPRVPFSGRGQSGYGITRGAAGLLEMTQIKAIVTARRWFKPHLQPSTPADAELLEQLIRVEHAPGLVSLLAAVPRLARAALAQSRFRSSQPGSGT
jgi:acyl-CoA reductase-like NAD-dependent aldehyde dehydrogenase